MIRRLLSPRRPARNGAPPRGLSPRALATVTLFFAVFVAVLVYQLVAITGSG